MDYEGFMYAFVVLTLFVAIGEKEVRVSRWVAWLTGVLVAGCWIWLFRGSFLALAILVILGFAALTGHVIWRERP